MRKIFTLIALFLIAVGTSALTTSAYAFWSETKNANLEVLLSYAGFRITTYDQSQQTVELDDTYEFEGTILPLSKKLELYATGKTSILITLESSVQGNLATRETLETNAVQTDFFRTKFIEVNTPGECVTANINSNETSTTFTVDGDTGPFNSLHTQTTYVCLQVQALPGVYVNTATVTGNVDYNGTPVIVQDTSSWGADVFAMPENFNITYTPTLQ